jgi:hypothetical protein
MLDGLIRSTLVGIIVLIVIGMTLPIVGFSLFVAWKAARALVRMAVRREWQWPLPLSYDFEPDDCRRCSRSWVPTGEWNPRRQEGEFTCGCRVVWFCPTLPDPNPPSQSRRRSCADERSAPLSDSTPPLTEHP